MITWKDDVVAAQRRSELQREAEAERLIQVMGKRTSRKQIGIVTRVLSCLGKRLITWGSALLERYSPSHVAHATQVPCTCDVD